MKSVFGKLKRDPRAPSRVIKKTVRPHGVREERIISEIADSEARNILFQTHATGRFLWTGDDVDAAGISMLHTEPEVISMIRERIIARISHHVDVEAGEDGDIRSTTSSTPLFRADQDLSAARTGAVEVIRPLITKLAEKTAEDLVMKLDASVRSHEVHYKFLPERSLPWPLQGWDHAALNLAGRIFEDGFLSQMKKSGYGIKPMSGGKVFVRENTSSSGDPEP